MNKAVAESIVVVAKVGYAHRHPRHPDENLPTVQLEFRSGAMGDIDIGRMDLHGAVDVIREDHDGRTTLSWLFSTEKAASSFLTNLKQLSPIPGLRFATSNATAVDPFAIVKAMNNQVTGA